MKTIFLRSQTTVIVSVNINMIFPLTQCPGQHNCPRVWIAASPNSRIKASYWTWLWSRGRRLQTSVLVAMRITKNSTTVNTLLTAASFFLNVDKVADTVSSKKPNTILSSWNCQTTKHSNSDKKHFPMKRDRLTRQTSPWYHWTIFCSLDTRQVAGTISSLFFTISPLKNPARFLPPNSSWGDPMRLMGP